MLKFCYHDSTVVYQLLLAFRGERLQTRNGILLFALLVTRAVGYPCVLACTDLCPYALYTLSRRSSFLIVLLASSAGACCEGAPMPRHAQSARLICAEMWEISHVVPQCVCACENDGRTAPSGDPVMSDNLPRDGLKTDAGCVCVPLARVWNRNLTL